MPYCYDFSSLSYKENIMKTKKKKKKPPAKDLLYALANDDEYRFGWFCNLCMAVCDSIDDDLGITFEKKMEIGREAARRFLNVLLVNYDR
jgi:hypothetical protein